MGRRPATRHYFVAAFLLLPAGIASASEPVSAREICRGAKIISAGDALSAQDGATIRLKDGREVRLAGVAAPDELDGSSEAARQATVVLGELIAGRRVRLHAEKDNRDRYGRIVAQVALEDSPGTWVQAALVAGGHARVLPGSGSPDCSERLLTLERQARKQAQGLWSDTDFSILKADAVPPAHVAAGRFVLVEAVVRRVGESGGRFFLDFGRRYREDFTIVIPREAHAAFAAAGVDLRALSGKRVRARGVLFSWGGPAMELRVPGALELIEAGEG